MKTKNNSTEEMQKAKVKKIKKEKHPKGSMKAVEGGEAVYVPKAKHRHSKRALFEKIATSPFMIPSIIGVLVFFIIPFMVVIYYSFIDGTVSANFVGFDNYVKLFKSSAFKMALKNTGVFSATAVPLVVILSLALAVLLD